MAEKPYDARETINAVRLEVDELSQETALAALSAVVIGTPVGDPTLWQNPESAPDGYVGGHARRNWHVSLTGFRQTLIGRAGQGPGEGGASSEAIDTGRITIDKFRVEAGPLYLFNNVPYIGVLNDGHSTQAPQNFVEKAIQAATAIDTGGRKEVP